MEPPEAPTWPPPSDVAGRGARAPTGVGPPVPPFSPRDPFVGCGVSESDTSVHGTFTGTSGGGRRENSALSCMGSKPIGNDAARPIGPGAPRLDRSSSCSYNCILKRQLERNAGPHRPVSHPKNQFPTLLFLGGTREREKEVPLKIRRNRE